MTTVRCFAHAVAVIGGAVLVGGFARAQTPAPASLDPLQQAVVDSLAFPRRTAPPELLDAVFRAADVEAFDTAAGYLGQLMSTLEAAGEERQARLNELAQAFDAADLASLERRLRGRVPEITAVVGAIRAADALRRRDPERLAQAAADLRGVDAAARAAAARTLADAGLDALPVLVDLVREPGAGPARATALALLRELGPAAREPLLAWLGSPDLERWDGVITALGATGDGDISDFLLAPALVADTPPAVRSAAERVLAARATGRGVATTPPTRVEAIGRLARRLDGVLSPEGLPAVDRLLTEPGTPPAAVGAVCGATLGGTVERYVWNPEMRAVAQRDLPPRLARALDAEHLARDLVALAPDDPAVIRLILLARLESALAAAAVADQRLSITAVRGALAGPDGFDTATAASVMETAIERGLWNAAAAAATGMVPPDAEGGGSVRLPPEVRKSLVRALALPDAEVQFAAARTLARLDDGTPFAGSSLVVKVLIHAAGASGEDRVVVAHPDRVVGEELATGVSRFGYEPVVVRTGREAVFAARSSPDVVLVLLAARSIAPGALETVQYLRQPGLGTPPPVLVVVDPFDDDGRGRYLQKQLLAFADLDGAVLVDRLPSFFGPLIDEETGSTTAPPRFPDALAQLVGPAAIDPATRAAARAARLDRARDALGLLAALGQRGHDVSGALDAALRGIQRPDLTAPAAAVLSDIGQPVAQYALFREATRASPPAGEAATSALRAHVARHGVLVDGGTVDEACARYTGGSAEVGRSAAGAALEALGVPREKLSPKSVDGAPPRSTR